MKPNQPKRPLPDHDHELENDALWNLLEESPPEKASPRFVQDTLRRVRLDTATQEEKSPWWRSLLAPKFLIGTAGVAGAALAAIAIFLALPSDPVAPPSDEIADAPTPTEDWNELENAVASELLSNAAEDPTLLSDSEIVALLF